MTYPLETLAQIADCADDVMLAFERAYTLSLPEVCTDKRYSDEYADHGRAAFLRLADLLGFNAVPK
jgi:hypothetical protein